MLKGSDIMSSFPSGTSQALPEGDEGLEPPALPAFLDRSPLPSRCPAGYAQGGSGPSEATHPSWSPGPFPAPRGRLGPAPHSASLGQTQTSCPAVWSRKEVSASPGHVGTVRTRQTGELQSLYLGPQIPAHRPRLQTPPRRHHLLPHGPSQWGKVTQAFRICLRMLMAASQRHHEREATSHQWAHLKGLR